MEAMERVLGLAKEVRFEEAIAERLRAEARKPHTEYKRRAVLEAHGVAVDAAIAPGHDSLQELTEKDWETVRASNSPLLTLFAASNYRDLDWQTKDAANRRGGRRRDPRTGYEGLTARAEVESAPLIHGLTAAAFVELDKAGVMHSNKTRYQETALDPLAFHTDRPGMTLQSDRAVGLDRQIFFDYARPAMTHRAQPEITLVVDPAGR
jgi:hypothetical protein